MNYFLRDINVIYPLSEYIEFPELSDYLTPEFITMLSNSGFYDESKIINKILRKYQYNEIGTSDISQFFDYMNELIEENYSEYIMNLITIAETYSIQNVDTRDEEYKHVVTKNGETLVINQDTPSNKLNIENIKAGQSASNVDFTTERDIEYTNTTHIEATSALNTTQSNIKSQLEINMLVQNALNKFVNNLYPAFAIIGNEYYE